MEARHSVVHQSVLRGLERLVVHNDRVLSCQCLVKISWWSFRSTALFLFTPPRYTGPVRNIAFIDGQNLHLGTKSAGWVVDHHRFRVYLRDKYKVDEVYFFHGFVNAVHQGMYRELQRAGYILEFREHVSALQSKKKGNVDTDLVFAAMQKLIDEPDEFEKIVLVSGDGDYFKLVQYLIEKDRFKKLLLPQRIKASSLYKTGIDNSYHVDLSAADLVAKLEYKRKGPRTH